jgi:hypothetical protein
MTCDSEKLHVEFFHPPSLPQVARRLWEGRAGEAPSHRRTDLVPEDAIDYPWIAAITLARGGRL